MELIYKTTDEIFAEMIALFREKTGLAVRLYVAAAQLEALNAQNAWVFRQSFPQTATEESLDMHAELRGLERDGGTAARGIVRFYTSGAAAEIPAGTVLLDSNLRRFETTEVLTIPKGETEGEIPARACFCGTDGNVGAGMVSAMALAPVGVAGVTNPAGFLGGTEAEDDETLRLRILDSFRRLPNGANAVYYETVALACEGVAAVTVVPRPRGRGTVDIYVAAGDGLPSPELISAVRAELEKRREIAVDLEVLVPTAVPVDISLKITPKEGAFHANTEAAASACEAAVRAALLGYFTGERLGTAVYRSALTALLLGCEGVENVEVLLPDSDIPAAKEKLPTLGNIEIAAF